MGRQRPGSVTSAIRAQLALVGVAGLTTLLTIVERDELVRAWTARHPTGIDPPAYVPVAVVLFITFALLAAVLLVFFRDGHHSARLALTGLAVFSLFAMVVMFRQDPPVLFNVFEAVVAVLSVVLVCFLWHPDTSAYLRGVELADELDA
jgi:hypothetical protein